MVLAVEHRRALADGRPRRASGAIVLDQARRDRAARSARPSTRCSRTCSTWAARCSSDRASGSGWSGIGVAAVGAVRSQDGYRPLRAQPRLVRRAHGRAHRRTVRPRRAGRRPQRGRPGRRAPSTCGAPASASTTSSTSRATWASAAGIITGGRPLVGAAGLRGRGRPRRRQCRTAAVWLRVARLLGDRGRRAGAAARAPAATPTAGRDEVDARPPGRRGGRAGAR